MNILYSSKTGHTEKYAKMLSEKTGFPVYSLDEAKKSLPEKSEVIYFSWLMAGKLADYKKVKEKYNISAVCAVGLGPVETDIRKANGIFGEIKVFPLKGGYKPERLFGIYKFIMKLVVKMLIKQISEKTNKTAEDDEMLYVLKNGGSFVDERNLANIISYIGGENK